MRDEGEERVLMGKCGSCMERVWEDGSVRARVRVCSEGEVCVLMGKCLF